MALPRVHRDAGVGARRGGTALWREELGVDFLDGDVAGTLTTVSRTRPSYSGTVLRDAWRARTKV
jgi:hypothetical protein